MIGKLIIPKKLQKIIQISSLGSYGRLGNCLFQYAIAKKHADLANCELQTPEWVGEKIFEIKNARIANQLPEQKHDYIKWGQCNINLCGSFQFQEAIQTLSKKELKTWFKVKQKWINLYPKKHSIVAHVRREDYLQFKTKYCIISNNSYVKAFEKFNINLDDVVFIPKNSTTDFMGILSDFMILLNADVIFRANSTFSWWGSVLSDAKTYSPLVEDHTGECDVEFVEGNWPRMADSKNCSTKLTDLYLSE